VTEIIAQHVPRGRFEQRARNTKLESWLTADNLLSCRDKGET
jgi:hypothetical protein